MLSVDGHLDTEQMLHLANTKSACCSISKDNTAKIPNRQHGCQIYRKYICVLYPIITSTCGSIFFILYGKILSWVPVHSLRISSQTLYP